jgi:Methyltransferase domain
MFPFWDDVIAPLIDAVEARRVIEIGALRGDTTVRMLDSLGADCELHVIDPLPQFDPAEHEAAFPGRYIFHLGISHDVLPTLPPADVALVDGDHNWYTVFNELKMLAATAKEANAPLPLLICHDVGWPYGRRDLYYDVSRIPETHRRRHTHAGMLPGNKGLVFGGMNFELDNAGIEGGRHNGVFTAVEDFIAQHKAPLRLVVLPAYFGLAIIADEAQLAAHPRLGPILDRFETVEGMRSLVELGERIRIDETITTQTWLRSFKALMARTASRYLAVTKAALLDEHYIDNEVRLQHLARLLGENKQNPDLSVLRDPKRQLRQAHLRITRARAAGR